MKNDSDVLVRNNIQNYSSYTGIGDKPKNRNKNLLLDLLKKAAEIESTIVSEQVSDDLEGKGLKLIISSNIIDVYTRLEFLEGLKLSGHTVTLTEVSNLIGELYRKGEMKIEKKYRNDPNNFHAQ